MAYFVGRDLRTTTGRNLKLVADETGLNLWILSSSHVKKGLSEQVSDIPEEDTWMIPFTLFQR